MLGGFYLWIHESTHFFLQATWRDLTLIPPSKYSESSEKLKAPYFFFPAKKNAPHYHSSFHSYILNLQKLWGFLGRLLSISWLNRTLVSIHHKLSDHLEKPGRLVGRGQCFSENPGFCVKRLDPETQNPSEFTTATPWVNPNSNTLESWQGICVERGSVYRTKFPNMLWLWYILNFDSTRF